MDYKLDIYREEVIYCAGCAREYDPAKLSSWKCPSCNKTLVSRYKKTESRDDAVRKWRQINGLGS